MKKFGKKESFGKKKKKYKDYLQAKKERKPAKNSSFAGLSMKCPIIDFRKNVSRETNEHNLKK